MAKLLQSAMAPSEVAAGLNQQGEALALMGVALLMLMQDLAVLEAPLGLCLD